MVLHPVDHDHPDGRHARGDVDLFGFIHIEQAFCVHMRAGEDLLRAGQRGDIGQAPGVDVEHRHHGQNHVVV